MLGEGSYIERQSKGSTSTDKWKPFLQRWKDEKQKHLLHLRKAVWENRLTSNRIRPERTEQKTTLLTSPVWLKWGHAHICPAKTKTVIANRKLEYLESLTRLIVWLPNAIVNPNRSNAEQHSFLLLAVFVWLQTRQCDVTIGRAGQLRYFMGDWLRLCHMTSRATVAPAPGFDLIGGCVWCCVRCFSMGPWQCLWFEITLSWWMLIAEDSWTKSCLLWSWLL